MNLCAGIDVASLLRCVGTAASDDILIVKGKTREYFVDENRLVSLFSLFVVQET